MSEMATFLENDHAPVEVGRVDAAPMDSASVDLEQIESDEQSLCVQPL